MSTDAHNHATGLPDSTTTICDQLITSIYTKLPQELFDRVADMVFESAFCPGYLFPHQTISKTPHHLLRGDRIDAAEPQLLCLSKTVLSKYQTRMWSENTWVIGVGEPSDSTNFLQLLPTGARDFIHKIDMTFTSNDLGENWVDSPWDLEEITAMDGEEPSFESHEAWEQYHAKTLRGQLESMIAKLHHIWFEKHYDINLLSLTELTLDFSECYGPWGQWLGTDLAESLNPFYHGFPTLLNIIAPDEDKHEEIMKAICVRNGKTWVL
ncbi:MAG: hypothetical protein Q9166_005363 [cf. Caloplaca sp. 2 TL-2023]